MKRIFIKTLIASVALAAAGVSIAQDVKTIKFANQNTAGHPIILGMEKFKEIVEKNSGGKIKVNVFPGGALGSDQANVSAIQGGTLEMASMNSGIFANQVKEFAIFDFPFLFGSSKEADAVVDGPFGKKLHARLEDKGIVGLGYYELGFRHISNSKRPINKVEDLEGLKLRVIPNPMFMESFGALGTNPVPMAFTELYGALDSKAMDAQENPFAVIFTSKFYEVQKFLSVTNHVYTSNPVVISKKTWDKLSAEEQKLIQEAVTEGGLFERKLSRDTAKKFRQDLTGKGMQINDVPAATLTKMQELTKPTIEKFSATYDPTLVNLYRSEMERIRKAIP